MIGLDRVRKLANLRARPRVSLVFRSGWEWVAVEGAAELDDVMAAERHTAVLIRPARVYSNPGG